MTIGTSLTILTVAGTNAIKEEINIKQIIKMELLAIIVGNLSLEEYTMETIKMVTSSEPRAITQTWAERK